MAAAEDRKRVIPPASMLHHLQIHQHSQTITTMAASQDPPLPPPPLLTPAHPHPHNNNNNNNNNNHHDQQHQLPEEISPSRTVSGGVPLQPLLLLCLRGACEPRTCLGIVMRSEGSGSSGWEMESDSDSGSGSGSEETGEKGRCGGGCMYILILYYTVLYKDETRRLERHINQTGSSDAERSRRWCAESVFVRIKSDDPFLDEWRSQTYETCRLQ
jgi:hypothetical protein